MCHVVRGSERLVGRVLLGGIGAWPVQMDGVTWLTILGSGQQENDLLEPVNTDGLVFHKVDWAKRIADPESLPYANTVMIGNLDQLRGFLTANMLRSREPGLGILKFLENFLRTSGQDRFVNKIRRTMGINQAVGLTRWLEKVHLYPDIVKLSKIMRAATRSGWRKFIVSEWSDDESIWPVYRTDGICSGLSGPRESVSYQGGIY